MSRISETFHQLKKNEKTCLISYITAGDPSLDDSLDIMNTLVNSGTDIIELGVPFSDPMADGPTIQKSSTKALRNGMRTEKLFQQLENIRNEIS